MKLTISLLIGLLSLMRCSAEVVWNQTNVDRWRKDFLKDYDANSRPEHHNIMTQCNISLTLINADLDETRGVLVSHTWFKMFWTDSKLKWDNASYGGIDHIHVAPDEVWQPDVTVYNSAEANIVDHFMKTNKIVYSGGTVLWVPPAKVETYCAMDLKLWPFDVQTCSIKIGSWTYSGHKLDLQTTADAIDIEQYQENREWKILKTSHERHETFYPCCVEPYVDITFNFVFERHSPMYKAIVVTPAFVIVSITLASFWLPPTAGEKLLLNGIACVVICMLLMYFSQLLPILASSSPLIVIFYSHTLYLLCISFIISVIVINMSRNRKQYMVPRSIKVNILDGFIGKMLVGAQPESLAAESHLEELRETPFEEHRHSDDHQIIQTPSSVTKPHQAQNEWIRLAIFIDRVAFFIYIFVFIVMGFLNFI